MRVRLVIVVRDAVDGLVEQERIGGRDIPGKPAALAHHQGDRLQKSPVALPGRIAEHAGLPAVGWSRPESIFSVVVLPAPFGPRNPTTSPAWMVEGDLLDGLDIAVFAAKKAAHG